MLIGLGYDIELRIPHAYPGSARTRHGSNLTQNRQIAQLRCRKPVALQRVQIQRAPLSHSAQTIHEFFVLLFDSLPCPLSVTLISSLPRCCLDLPPGQDCALFRTSIPRQVSPLPRNRRYLCRCSSPRPRNAFLDLLSQPQAGPTDFHLMPAEVCSEKVAGSLPIFRYPI